MKLLSVPVLGAAAVLTAPALWAALTGELPVETAAVRYAVVAVLTWLALSALALVVGPPPAAEAAAGADGADGDGALAPTAVLPAVDPSTGV
ncbi:hypothetical protein QWY28_11340 [Nocardioides sp. SOB77]|uniref:Uncharacterized protein n=1 Tax=Nocardioides oceani TaxID=3058369 RepID=A0ABT8FFS2_9ACTN|nr:hypothetical protein [Nocardioides oceani]MDN4173541.1 hypothetical protein [Nocardioides oceani]